MQLATDTHLAQKANPWAKNHSTRDSQVVPHLGTNRAALSLTSQIGRDAVLSEPYGRGWETGGFVRISGGRVSLIAPNHKSVDFPQSMNAGRS